MMLGILTLLSALTISAVAIYYSVAGLVAIFAAAALPIIIMGGALEVGKLVTAVWLHRYWNRATWWLKTYLTTAVFVLMFITSMGIFGFLSKAHIEQTSASQESVAQVERITGEIQRQEDIIKRAEEQIRKLETTGTGNDANIQNQIDKEQERIDNAYKRIQPAINEQQAIIDSQAKLYENELAKIDQDMATLQGYIDSGETKKAQQMIGASADGVFGKKTADRIGEWQAQKQKERNDLIAKIKEARNNPQARAALNEIKRLRQTVESQIAESNRLINRLRGQLGNTDKAANIDSEIDEQTLRIKNANTEIDKLVSEKFALEGEYRKLEAEVGPIKYIAEFIYGEQADNNLLEEAVRWVIIVIIFVFDPLAVLLLIASQYTFHWYRKDGGLPPKPLTGLDPEDRKEDSNDLPMEKTDPDADATVRDVVPEEHVSDNDADVQPVEQTEVQPDGPEQQVEPALSKKKDNQYLLWPDIDPDVPQEYVEEEKISEPYVDPNQLEFDFDFYERQEQETEEDYVKRIWKKENPGLTIEFMKKLKDNGTIDRLPWDPVDETIQDMKDKGQWPNPASEKAQDEVTAQLEKINDLDAWNEWVDAANKAAEEEPEKTFKQNSEQTETSTWAKINEARKNFDPEKLKELTISEEQYRDASQQHIINLINRLKKGLITVSDLSASEADKIKQLLNKEIDSGKN